MVEKRMAKSIIDQNKNYIIYYSFVNTDQVYITASITEKNAKPIFIYAEIYSKIIEVLVREKMNCISDRIFGSTRFYTAVIETRKNILQTNGINSDMPFTYIQGNPCWGNGISGIQISAVLSDEGNKIWTIYDNNIPCGRKWKRNGATFILLQNVYDNNYSGEKISREEQACRMFDRADKILKENSCSYKNVVRTWIYLTEILGWYTEFNKARNAKYSQFGFIPNHSSKFETEKIYLPASTGISGLNPNNAASVMDILAVIPEAGSCVRVEQTSGIKQRSPYHYGSAFSRAMNIRESNYSTILLSGTASIDKEGKTVHSGDIRSQILKTYDIVDALIREEGASLNNICTATVFLKRPEDFEIYQKISEENGFNKIPAVCTVADVCRDDLLFELDATVAIESN
jgi:enamine deaminase RidA (YjgF/YER057c/UK114 family)